MYRKSFVEEEKAKTKWQNTDKEFLVFKISIDITLRLVLKNNLVLCLHFSHCALLIYSTSFNECIKYSDIKLWLVFLPYTCSCVHTGPCRFRLPNAWAPTLVGTKLLYPSPPDRLRKSAKRWVTQVAVLHARFCTVVLLERKKGE